MNLQKRMLFLVIFAGVFLFPSISNAAYNMIKPDHGRTERKLGDIFIGMKIASGITDLINNLAYRSADTKIIDKSMYFYNLGFTAEFYLASYAAIMLDYGLHSLRFDRKSIWSNGPNSSKTSEKFFEQWFNRLTISSRFLFWDIFYVQTGPSLLINYNAAAFKNFLGISPVVNDTPGVALSWQIGLGVSTVAGFKDNGEPLMTIDAGFYTYIPVTGYLVDSKASINAGGSHIRVTENPYQFEFSLAFTFLVS